MRGTRLVAGEKGLYEEDAADRIFEAALDLPLRRAVLRQLGIHRRAEQAAANLIVIFVAQGRAARAPDADDLPRRACRTRPRVPAPRPRRPVPLPSGRRDRKSTRLNSSH